MEHELFEKTILIVDDTPENIDVLNGLLSNYKRKLALNGERALKIAFADNPPDLILLDIMMPGIDGFEVCRQLRADERTKNVPIIFLTAKFDKESVVQGFELGAQDFVSKPFDPNELLSRVNTQLQLKHQQEKLENMNVVLEEKVTERTAQLNDANQELLALDSAKNNFLRLVSHEIRTPLNGIIGSTSLLYDMYSKDEEMKDFFEMLKVSAERLDKFAMTALVITQLQTRNFVVDTSEINLLDIIDTVIENNKDQAEKKEVTITKLITDDEMKLSISADLCKIALNTLVSNAIKYTPEKSKVIVNCYVEDGKYICEVSDQGNGFDEQTRENALKPFGGSAEHSDLIIGIDIAATNMIMKAHGGSFDIQKNEPNGALVRLCFNCS